MGAAQVGERVWCSHHRTRARVVDTFTESTYERSGEQSFRVTELACGCYQESVRVRVGAAPGAPYSPHAGRTLMDPWLDREAQGATA